MRSVEEMLDQPVEELIVPDVQIRLPEGDLGHWAISNRDFWASTSLGLPLIEVCHSTFRIRSQGRVVKNCL